MSRNDEFDIINLTENLEKNTEDLIREVKTQSHTGRNAESYHAEKINADMYGGNKRELNTDMYGGNRRELNTDMYGENRREPDTNMYGERERKSDSDLYGGGRKQNSELYGGNRRESNPDMYREGRGESNSGTYREGRRESNPDMYREGRRESNPDMHGRNRREAADGRYPERDGNFAGRQRVENKRKNYRDSGDEEMLDRRREKKKPSRIKRKLKHKLIKIAVVIAVLFAIIYGLIYSVVSKTDYEQLETDYVRPSDVETVSGVKNILLIGTDARSSDEDGRSDSMIILSINSKKNKIVMSSILRDSYVEIPGHGSNRINAAYSYGTESLLIQTIEQNFKIPIDAYAKVDFFSFIDIVDAVGGVEIDVSEEEKEWVNAYLNETNELLGKEFGDGYLTSAGPQTLTGKQALSYARIRYIGTDFGRTERQRKILTAVMDKVKKNPASVSKLLGSVLPSVTTDIKDSELTMMAMKSVLYMGYDMEQFCIPADGTWKNATISGMSVLEVDFDANIAAFKEAVYE